MKTKTQKTTPAKTTTPAPIESDLIARAREVQAKRRREILESIEVACNFNNVRECYGFGFRKSDGQLVEFAVPPAQVYSPEENNTFVQEITLAGSLEWFSAFYFAEERMSLTIDEDSEAKARWIRELHKVVAAAEGKKS